MPFSKEKRHAEKSLALIRAIVKEKWGVELDTLYPALVARIGQTDFQFELTPLLRDDENGRVVLLGSEKGESLVIDGGSLYRADGGMVDKYEYNLMSALVRAVISGGEEAGKTRTKDGIKLKEVFGDWARIGYLFDTIPLVPQVGLAARTYIVDFTSGDSQEAGMLRCFSFLLSADWGKSFALGGAVND